MYMSGRRGRRQADVWPGYVDALAALLILVIFVVLLFTFTQFLLSQLLSSQETELASLNARIVELTDLLGLEQKKTAQLEQNVSELSDVITALSEDKSALSAQIEGLEQQNRADQTQIEQQLLTIGSLQEDIAALRELRAKLETRVGELAGSLSTRAQELGAARDRSKALEAKLAEEGERTRLAQTEIEQRDIRIQALSALVGERQQALDEERRLSADAQAEVVLLNKRIGDLQRQLEEINMALASAEQAKQAQQAEIEDLGQRLNIELARRVNRLEQYQSEFFGRLREVLKDNPSVRIVGDRFLFQSELLFDSGSADLGSQGKGELTKLAGTLREVADKIPADIDWVLRVDGHTDLRPIRTEQFPSNWELSTARAVSVVRFLASQGIPERRLTAAGFAEFHPLVKARTEEAYAKNRRIEIKLTSR